MKKLIFATFCLMLFLFSGTAVYAQGSGGNAGSPGNLGNAGNAGNSPTPANVLRWAKEAQPHFAAIIKKLNKIKPERANDIQIKKSILESDRKIKLIIAAGSKLKAVNARTYDTWFRDMGSSWIDDCLEQNPGSECCFSCQGSGGSGWGASWCAANCFLFRFPGID